MSRIRDGSRVEFYKLLESCTRNTTSAFERPSSSRTRRALALKRRLHVCERPGAHYPRCSRNRRPCSGRCSLTVKQKRMTQVCLSTSFRDAKATKLTTINLICNTTNRGGPVVRARLNRCRDRQESFPEGTPRAEHRARLVPWRLQPCRRSGRLPHSLAGP